MIKKLSIIFLGWLLTTHVVTAQGVNVKAYLDSTSILIGQALSLHLEAEAQAQDTIIWPAIADTITKNIEILTASKIDTAYDSNDIAIKRMQQHFLITSFDSGYFAIPPFDIMVNGELYQTEPLLIQVNNMQVDTSKGIADIKEPIDVPFSWKEWLEYNWKWLALAALVILCVIGTIWYLKKRKKETPIMVVKPKPTVPPHKTALKKLRELEHKKLWQNGKVKQYHSEISEILREYIEKRYEFNALELTTYEIIQSLSQRNTDKELITQLEQTLFLNDMVKFAKATPIASENENCLQFSIKFIEQTKLSQTEINNA